MVECRELLLCSEMVRVDVRSVAQFLAAIFILGGEIILSLQSSNQLMKDIKRRLTS